MAAPERIRRLAALLAVGAAAVAVSGTSPDMGGFQPAAFTSQTIQVALDEGESRAFDVQLRTVRGIYGEYDVLIAGLTVTATVVDVRLDADAGAERPIPDEPVRVRVLPADEALRESRYHRPESAWLPFDAIADVAAVTLPCCEGDFRVEVQAQGVDFVRVELTLLGEVAAWVGPEEDEPPEFGSDRRIFLDVFDVP